MTKEVPRTSVLRDEELIAYLRLQGLDKDIAAATRIEELISERDQWIAHAKNAIWSDSEELKLVEDLLTKAVAELERLGFDFASNLGRELKPTTKWPEETGNTMVGEMKSSGLEGGVREMTDLISRESVIKVAVTWVDHVRERARKAKLCGASSEVQLGWIAVNNHLSGVLEDLRALPAIDPMQAPRVKALVGAAEKVINSYWHSTDGVITGIYDLEAALAELKGESQ